MDEQSKGDRKTKIREIEIRSVVSYAMGQIQQVNCNILIREYLIEFYFIAKVIQHL